MIPVFNEFGSIAPLCEKLGEAVQLLDCSEVIFVDDGSTDGSWEELLCVGVSLPSVRLVRLTQNFGQHAAIAAGMDAAKGEALCILDADLQNDPLDILKIHQKLVEGFDYVSGSRVNRHESLFGRRFPSRLLNVLISRLTGVTFSDHFCALKGFRRSLCEKVKQMGSDRLCLPSVFAKLCEAPTQISVCQQPRVDRSRYCFLSLLSLSVRCVLISLSPAARLVFLPLLAGLVCASLVGIWHLIESLSSAGNRDVQSLSVLGLIVLGSLAAFLSLALVTQMKFVIRNRGGRVLYVVKEQQVREGSGWRVEA